MATTFGWAGGIALLATGAIAHSSHQGFVGGSQTWKTCSCACRGVI